MPKYKKSHSTAKAGVNYVRSIVEAEGCIFHKIEQDNDLGIDALLELIRDEEPLHKQVAVQIKSGKSYYDAKSGECLIPIKNHRVYWEKYPLPVIGVVYLPQCGDAYWINVKAFLEANPDASVIRFTAAKINAFNEKSFSSLFVRQVLNETPDVPFKEAVAFLKSEHPDEVHLGMVVLFRRYPNEPETWDLLIELFKNAGADSIPPVLIYFFAHVPWHGDIWSVGEGLTDETREYVRKKHFKAFGAAEVIKLLEYVDEAGFSRGALGQSVEAIISSLPQRCSLLEAILEDNSQPMEIRERAALIYAMHEPEKALLHMGKLNSEESEWMGELIAHIKEFGAFNPYC